jgi:nitrogen fixation protein
VEDGGDTSTVDGDLSNKVIGVDNQDPWARVPPLERGWRIALGKVWAAA